MVFNDYMEDALAIGDVCGEMGLGSSDTRLFNYIHGRYFPNGLNYFIGDDRGEFMELLNKIGLKEEDTLYINAMLLNRQSETLNEDAVISVLSGIHDQIYDNRIPEVKQNVSRMRLFIDPDFREKKMAEYNSILNKVMDRERQASDEI